MDAGDPQEDGRTWSREESCEPGPKSSLLGGGQDCPAPGAVEELEGDRGPPSKAAAPREQLLPPAVWGLEEEEQPLLGGRGFQGA